MNLEEEMMKMMGFSSLGKKKQSQKVDLIEKAKQRKEMLLNEKTNDEQDAGCKNKDFNSKDRRDVDYGRNTIVGTVSKDTKVTNDDDDDDDGDDDDDDGVDGTNDGDDDGIGYYKDSNDILDRFPEEDCFLCDHFKACTSFSLDKANSRLVTGARDHLVKLWDFNGMISTLKPFMSFEAAEGNLIRDVKFSNSGDSFIVAPSSWQPKLYDRDGKDVCTFSKGDPYIRDLKHVYGHTSGLTCIEWHPQKKHSFMTASLDSTVRIWDLENRSKSKSHFFIKGVKAGDRYGMNSATFSMDGRYIASSDCKGRVMVWSSENSTSKPIHLVNGHVQGTVISGTTFSKNGYNILTRGMDDTLKQWDLRKFTEPVGMANDLYIFHEEANAIYSPNERFIVAGTAGRKGGSGKIVVYEKNTMELVKQVDCDASVVKLMWPSQLNQLFVGLSNGNIRVLYDPETSQGGVTIPLSKAPKKLAVDDYDLVIGGIEVQGEVVDPEPIPEGEEEEIQGTWTKDRNRTKPEMPYTITGAGKGGQIGTNLTQHIMKSYVKNRIREEDPREALLKYAEIAKNEPYWVDPAYSKTGKNKLAENVYEDDVERIRESKKRRKQ